jgi:hypothetical protein
MSIWSNIKSFLGFGNPAPMQQNMVAQENLVAWWKMDDDAASTVVLDSSGNGYDGASVRNTHDMHVAGKIDGALQFDGVNDYINTGQNFESAFQDNFTISLWLIPPNIAPIDIQTLLGLNGVFGLLYLAIIADGDMEFIYYPDPEQTDVEVVSNEGAIQYGQEIWYNLTVVVTKLSPSTAQAEMFLNGVSIKLGEIFTVDLSLYHPTETIYIGSINNAGTPEVFFNGSLDDIRIYNKALSADEVLQLYNEANPAGEDFSPTGQRYLMSNY